MSNPGAMVDFEINGCSDGRVFVPSSLFDRNARVGFLNDLIRSISSQCPSKALIEFVYDRMTLSQEEYRNGRIRSANLDDFRGEIHSQQQRYRSLTELKSTTEPHREMQESF
jgi:hypothetical protein